ncbi:MAG: ATP-binding protein [Verrucomicrobia bacterium]|nr:ATP-binding protein [Verrucomicrobiota bacterium]
MAVDLSGQIYRALQGALDKARRANVEGRTAEARATYRECARLMQDYAKYAPTLAEKVRRLNTAKEYLAQAEGKTERAEPAPAVPPASAPAAKPSSAAAERPRDAYSDAIEALVYRARVTWADIGGLDETKREIRSAFALGVVKTPAGLNIEGWRNILLYGPPGTGKTLLAAAASNEIAATFLNVRAGDVLSKYFGESTRLVSALFAYAAAHEPCVVFLDEFDALGIPRDQSDSGAERRMLSAILTELDGLSGKGARHAVLTIAATNAPWALDAAALSRFDKRIYVPLPDRAARAAVLRIHLDAKGYRLDGDYGALAAATDGTSGRELARLCKEVANRMIHEANPDLIDRNVEALKAYTLHTRPLTMADFEPVLASLKAETPPAAVRRYEAFASTT